MKPYIVIDTETAPAPNYDAKWPGGTSLVYDCGWIVTDGEHVFERRSFVVRETFENDTLMNSAYYRRKLPMYRAGLGVEWTPAQFIEVWHQFLNDCKTYKVQDVWAFNAQFDRDTLNNTINTYSNGYRPFFLPYGLTWKCIRSAAGDTVCNTRKYAGYCILNGYLTDNNNPRTSAEVIYRYLTGNDDFIEAHMALNDCEIENDILQRVRKRKQKHSTKPNGQAWRKPKKRAEEYRRERSKKGRLK